jgi:L-cysteine desulfidase
MNDTVTIQKTSTTRSNRFGMALSFLLIYPIFGLAKHEKEITINMEILSKYRENLLDVVLRRKELLKIFYSKYKNKLKLNISKMCQELLRRNVVIYNVNMVELEIEGLHHIIQGNFNSNKDIVKYLNENFLPSENEFNSLVHTYNSIYQTVIMNNRHYP